MIESSPGITRLLDRLEEKKLVRRVHCPKDRRRVLCSVTPGGLRLLEALDEPVGRADEKVLGRLSRADVETLIRLLDAIREGHGGG
jgi:DNA-binding MarR family transcriptional regulator